MQALGSRRGGWITLAIVVAAVVAAAAFATAQYLARPAIATVLPAAGAAVNSATPAIGFVVDRDTRMGDLTVHLDGDDITDRLASDGDRVAVTPPRLADGHHRVEVAFRSGNIFSPSVSHSWEFEVDTTPPRLAVATPRPGEVSNTRRVRYGGTAEPGSRIRVSHATGTAEAVAGPRGRWTTNVRLPEGAASTVIRAADGAGNTTERRRRLAVDTVAPTFELAEPAADQQLTATDHPLIRGAVPGEDPRGLTFAVAVNGQRVISARGADAPLDPVTQVTQPIDGATATDGALRLEGRSFTIDPGALPQGRNRITVAVADRAGNMARITRTVRVETTEQFGAHAMVVGATGADVAALHQRLVEQDLLPAAAAEWTTYNARTVAAVKRYQKSKGMTVNGRVTPAVIDSMVGRIVVSLSQYRLRLIRGGKVVRSFPIAIGSPGHATPTGDYEIIQKQVDPTWFPPNSPWAAGLGPIPPGPGNPLGTRWIGTSAPAIGVHGTYADSSIGTAASHGCMRMHIADVEELYEEVSLGMKISIRP